MLLVKGFRAGEPVELENSPMEPAAPLAPSDLCLVKLLVGPGNAGSPGAPSTSAGIGIEVWLPAQWNDIVRTYGNGGWSGGFQSDVTRLEGMGVADPTHLAAVGKGYVVSTSDNGHAGDNEAGGTGSFAMREDGSINTTLWQDFSDRSLHELALKTKALATAYYGRAPRYAYWDGFSTGGRQGYKLAQKYPGDYQGILAGAPAFNWSRLTAAQVYPQVVMRLENGGPIAAAKLNAVSAAATAACGGTALGFLLDPLQCRYDPARDAEALCAGVTGRGVLGTNPDADTCISLAEANSINRIWYGQTRDGSYPDPALDNGAGPLPGDAKHLWWGMARGTSLTITAGALPFAIATDMLALVLQNPAYAQPDFINARGNGSNLWNTLDYAGLASVFDLGISLQPAFGFVNTDEADLSAFRAAGGKLLTYHGLADDYVMPQGTLNYFARAAAANGGEAELQKFDRLFLIPGLAHDATFLRTASIDPATGTTTDLNKVPLPQPASGRDELFTALRNWVENGTAPARFDLRSYDASVTLPICAWPRKATYKGPGPVTAAASYNCD